MQYSVNLFGSGTGGWVVSSLQAPDAGIATKNVTTSTGAVTIGNGTGQVVGTSNLTIDVANNSSSSAGLVTAGSGNINKVWGTDVSGNPSWTSANGELTTKNVTTSTGAVTIGNGTGQVVGASNLTIDVANNSSASAGLVTAGSGNNNKVWGTDGTGNPSWKTANSAITTNNIAPGTGSSVVVTNGTGQVVGGSNVTIDIQGTAGGVFYGAGAGTAGAFSAAGTAGQILKSNGAGAPTWVSPNSTLTTNNVTTSTTGVTITNGTGQIVGGSNMTINVATNSSSSPGLVTAGSGNNNKVWSTDASGNPGWNTLTTTTTNAWGLTGNGSTSPGTNFIGTTDANDLVIKTNGSEDMRISEPTGNVVIGSGEGTQFPIGNIIRPPYALQANRTGADFTIAAGAPSGKAASGSIIFQALSANVGAPGNTSDLSIMAEVMRINQDGALSFGSTGTAIGSANNVLLSGGSGTTPGWGQLPLNNANSVTGTLGIGNGGTGLSTTPTNGQILIGNGAGYTLNTITAGTGIGVTNASGSITISNTGVTSVALSLPNIFTVSGSPVTTTGTLTGTLATQSANTIFAGPSSGGAAAPTFRSLVVADIPSGSVTANNGLTVSSGNNVQLGGTLIQTTTITQGNFDHISNMNGTGNFKVQKSGSDAFSVLSASGNVVIGSGEGTGTVAGNTLRAPNAAGSNIAGANMTLISGDGTGTGGSGYIAFQTAPTAGSSSTANTLAERMRITPSGNIGIGTTNPLSLLHANGTLTLGTPSGGTTPATGTLTFNNSSSTQSINISAGNTTTGYSLTLPLLQGGANTMLKNDGAGTLSWVTPSSLNSNLTPGTGLTGSAYNGSAAQTFAVSYGSAAGTAVQGNTTLTVTAGTGMTGGGTITLGTGGTVTLNNSGVLSLTATVPLYNTGTATAPVIAIQGTATDKGGVLYSTGAGTSAAFIATGTAGNVLQSNGTSAPTFVAFPGWQITGNLGTSYPTNFIGTSDDQNLLFKVDGTISGRVEDSTDAGGHENTGLGFGTMSAMTGSYNTSLGFMALKSNSSANNNTAIGREALYDNTTGNWNTALGFDALRGNTTGTNNTANGHGALESNTTASKNTAIGYQALYTQNYSNTNTPWSSENVAIGYQSLFSDLSTASSNGYRNTAAGTNSLYNNTTGSGNAAFGDSALFNNLTANFNTAFGTSALFANTTGASNTAVGYSSLNGNTTGTLNTGIGENALANNTASSQNTALGYDALAAQSFSTASTTDNVAVGYKSLFVNQPTATTNSGSQNTSIGDNTLIANTTGYNNTAMGYNAGSTNTTGNNNTLLGSTANVASNALTNATALGAGASVSTSNTVVLGNTSVTNLEFNGALMPNVSGTYTAGTSGQVLTSAGAGTEPTWTTLTAANVNGWSTIGNGGTTAGTNFIGTTDANDFVVKTGTVPTERMRFLNGSGTVVLGSGEGGTTPVGGTFRAPSGVGTNINGGDLTITAGNGTGNGGSGDILFQTAPTGVSGATANTMSTRMSIIASGNVGVNTATPNTTLEVDGSVMINKRTAISSAYTVVGTDFYVELAATGTYTVTLPTAAATNAGRLIIVKRLTYTSGTVTVSVSGGGNIDAGANYTTNINAAYGVVRFMSTGTQWITF